MTYILQFIISLLLCSFAAQASQQTTPASTIQIDVIVFTQKNLSNKDNINSEQTSVSLTRANRVSGEIILPQPSSLIHELKLIKRQPQYQELFHYTWLQPSNNQTPVHLSVQSKQGWHVEGNIRIRQSNYYLLDSKLTFSTQHQPAFVVTQKQRLKPGTTYYLDHPKAGMLIKVHRIT